MRVLARTPRSEFINLDILECAAPLHQGAPGVAVEGVLAGLTSITLPWQVMEAKRCAALAGHTVRLSVKPL